MNATDQIKVLNAGFTIIRERDTGLKMPMKLDIYAKEKTQIEWHYYEGSFKSKASRKRRMAELLTNRRIVGD